MSRLIDADLDAVRAVLCDADGCLIPSEQPAFEAAMGVANRFLAKAGVAQRFTAASLMRHSLGRNFRWTLEALAREHQLVLPEAELADWLIEEDRVVTAHLRSRLTPDAAVAEPLAALSRRYRLAVVSSSGLSRLDACFEATGLAALLPPESRFSARDSLPTPTSKPDPAVYLLALQRLCLRPGEAVAVEDSVVGATSAIAAGIPTIGNLAFVPREERRDRAVELGRAGVFAVVDSWRALPDLLAGLASSPAPPSTDPPTVS